jgi:hypothetical protein
LASRPSAFLRSYHAVHEALSLALWSFGRRRLWTRRFNRLFSRPQAWVLAPQRQPARSHIVPGLLLALGAADLAHRGAGALALRDDHPMPAHERQMPARAPIQSSDFVSVADPAHAAHAAVPFLSRDFPGFLAAGPLRERLSGSATLSMVDFPPPWQPAPLLASRRI